MTTGTAEPTKIPVCQHKTLQVSREPDKSVFYRVYSGGMRAAIFDNNAWYIEPVLDDGKPSIKGFMPTAKLSGFFKQYSFAFIALHQIRWYNGNYHSNWCPLILGQTTHRRGPSDLWSSIARSLSMETRKDQLNSFVQPSYAQIAALFDIRSESARLASSISLSLSNMDISVEQIAQYYNEQLVNHMASGKLAGNRSSSTLDQTLFAHVHSFFMHLGAARDYLAAYCALRIGLDAQKVDSFAKLVGEIREEHFALDELLQLFHKSGYIQKKPSSSTKFEMAGWMKEVTDLRNLFIHRRPFGDRFIEKMGFASPVECKAGLYRYVRPMLVGDVEHDAQTVILRHYRKMIVLCHSAAMVSGVDTSMPTLTDAHIISIEIEDGVTDPASGPAEAAN